MIVILYFCTYTQAATLSPAAVREDCFSVRQEVRSLTPEGCEKKSLELAFEKQKEHPEWYFRGMTCVFGRSK
jgi:hypothetical protein